MDRGRRNIPLNKLIGNIPKRGQLFKTPLVTAYLRKATKRFYIPNILVILKNVKGYKFPFLYYLDNDLIKKPIRNDSPQADLELVTASNSITAKDKPSPLDLLINGIHLGICIDDNITVSTSWFEPHITSMMRSIDTNQFRVSDKYHAVEGEYKKTLLERLLGLTNDAIRETDDEKEARNLLDYTMMTDIGARFFMRKAMKEIKQSV